MQATKTVFIFLGLAASGLTLFGAAPFEYNSGSGTNLPPLMAAVRHEEGPGLLPADRVYATAGTNRYSFLTPPGYKMEPLGVGGIALVNRDYSCQITFRLVGPPPLKDTEISPETCTERILAEHPGAKVQSTFSSIADSRRGPAFEFQCTGTAGSWCRGQTAFIPSWNAVLEFSLVCSPEKFDAARSQLNTVMLTFRASDPKGELHISPLSDKL
jgi:hypothetical protein